MIRNEKYGRILIILILINPLSSECPKIPDLDTPSDVLNSFLQTNFKFMTKNEEGKKFTLMNVIEKNGTNILIFEKLQFKPYFSKNFLGISIYKNFFDNTAEKFRIGKFLQTSDLEDLKKLFQLEISDITYKYDCKNLQRDFLLSFVKNINEIAQENILIPPEIVEKTPDTSDSLGSAKLNLSFTKVDNSNKTVENKINVTNEVSTSKISDNAELKSNTKIVSATQNNIIKNVHNINVNHTISDNSELLALIEKYKKNTGLTNSEKIEIKTVNLGGGSIEQEMLKNIKEKSEAEEISRKKNEIVNLEKNKIDIEQKEQKESLKNLEDKKKIEELQKAKLIELQKLNEKKKSMEIIEEMEKQKSELLIEEKKKKLELMLKEKEEQEKLKEEQAKLKKILLEKEEEENKKKEKEKELMLISAEKMRLEELHKKREEEEKLIEQKKQIMQEQEKQKMLLLQKSEELKLMQLKQQLEEKRKELEEKKKKQQETNEDNKKKMMMMQKLQQSTKDKNVDIMSIMNQINGIEGNEQMELIQKLIMSSSSGSAADTSSVSTITTTSESSKKITMVRPTEYLYNIQYGENVKPITMGHN
jgi:hypothetical protein